MRLASDDLHHIANNILDIHADIRNKSFFITGGTGFFGKWLLESFVFLNKHYAAGMSLTVLSRNPESFRDAHAELVSEKGISLVKGDISDLTHIVGKYDYIIHAASDVPSSYKEKIPEDPIYKKILEGANSICQLAKSADTRRILYTSSGAAYGSLIAKLDKIDESSIGDEVFSPQDFYGLAKRDSETHFIENAPCEVVVARCFSFSGPYLPLNGSYAFGNFIHDILNNRDINIKGDGAPLRSYLYASDLVIWLLQALVKGRNRNIYNIGSEEAISIRQLAEKMLCVTKSKNKIVLHGAADVNGRVSQYVPFTGKIRNELGVSQSISLGLAIEKTMKFYKNEI